MRARRRPELVAAFARVLARHGYAGATVAAVAAEAGVAPGMIHHYFADKQELLGELLSELLARFRRRTRARELAGTEPLLAYLDAALELGDSADVTAARCWVGVLAEAVREPALFARVRRLLDGEVDSITRRSRGALGDRDGSALLAFVLGALVLGSFAPRRTAGFAAPSARRLAAALARLDRARP